MSSSKKAALSDLLGRGSTNTLKQDAVDTDKQEYVNTGKKKKATYDLDPDLHRRLKVYAAQHGGDMVEHVSRAIDLYLRDRDS